MGLAKAVNPNFRSPSRHWHWPGPIPLQLEDHVVKKITIAATALALIASTMSAVPATAAPTSAAAAKYGKECATLNSVAKAKGADGSDLVCKKETAGTFI